MRVQLSTSYIKTILVFFAFLFIQTSFGQSESETIKNAFTDASIKSRGKLMEESGKFRLEFHDIYESDSQAKYLQGMGYHGGGPSWLGIIFGAFKLAESDLIDQLTMNVEVTGVTFWSANKEELESIQRVISLIKSNDQLLLKSIDKAKEFDMML
ncbi:hypothetical protein [Tenacibaculum sp. IB213877]|uniref:hypothetical protein n=1 Tax=Tenacibaculum sp. IB213877 TaxID=3097351 RepID=UPI002A59AFDE|nr:hypothetical protein [Tenacibaculum sp. IB213877]MDY0779717.1 hypothetical protein [Tenacibaculum sp. IB213877]